MANHAKDAEETSNIAASGFRLPSAQAQPAHIALFNWQSNATGQVFLDRMAPPRPQIVYTQDSGVAARITTGILSPGSQKRKVEAMEAGVAPSIGPTVPRGSSPSIPSSIIHPTPRAGVSASSSVNKRPKKAFKAGQSIMTKSVRFAPDAVTPTARTTDKVTVAGTTTTNYHGLDAFTAIADLDMNTPSVQLTMKYKDGKITCVLTGHLSSHSFDDVLQSRVEANMKILKQDILGQPIIRQVMVKSALAIGHLKKASGNSAVVVGRLVEVVMNLFDYERVEDVSAEVRMSDDQFVEVVVEGFKLKNWTKFSLDVVKGFKGAFAADGKMSAEEQKYYDDMPMLGLEGLLEDDAEEISSAVATSIEPVPVEKQSGTAKPARKIRIASSRKQSQLSQVANVDEFDAQASAVEVSEEKMANPPNSAASTREAREDSAVQISDKEMSNSPSSIASTQASREDSAVQISEKETINSPDHIASTQEAREDSPMQANNSKKTNVSANIIQKTSNPSSDISRQSNPGSIDQKTTILPASIKEALLMKLSDADWQKFWDANSPALQEWNNGPYRDIYEKWLTSSDLNSVGHGRPLEAQAFNVLNNVDFNATVPQHAVGLGKLLAEGAEKGKARVVEKKNEIEKDVEEKTVVVGAKRSTKGLLKLKNPDFARED